MNRTSCVNEDTCGELECCVRVITSFNGGESNSNGGFCGNIAEYLAFGRKAIIGTSGTNNTFTATMHCFRDLNEDKYAALWDNANFFAFSMAVIFGLLALFAY